MEDSDKIFTEMIRSIERRRSEVKELIRDQEKAEVSQAEGLLERLEQEIAELKRRDAELEQLSHTEDDIHFLWSVLTLRVSTTFLSSFSSISLSWILCWILLWVSPKCVYVEGIHHITSHKSFIVRCTE